MNEIQATPGQSIHTVAARMVEAAPATCVLNDIPVVAKIGDTAGDVLANYARQSERRRAVYEASPEGKAARADSARRLSSAQEAVDYHIALLPSLGHGDTDVAIDWLAGMAEPLDYRGVTVDRATIIDTFRANGFMVDANVGSLFNPEDRENVARYIIGQALDGIQSVGSPHQIVRKFIADWRKKFAVAA